MGVGWERVKWKCGERQKDHGSRQGQPSRPTTTNEGSKKSPWGATREPSRKASQGSVEQWQSRRPAQRPTSCCRAAARPSSDETGTDEAGDKRRHNQCAAKTTTVEPRIGRRQRGLDGEAAGRWAVAEERQRDDPARSTDGGGARVRSRATTTCGWHVDKPIDVWYLMYNMTAHRL